MKLTWNQKRALENLADKGLGAELTPAQVKDPNWGFCPYLCGGSARTALMALTAKGLVECIPVSPMRYRITDAGRKALEERE